MARPQAPPYPHAAQPNAPFVFNAAAPAPRHAVPMPFFRPPAIPPPPPPFYQVRRPPVFPPVRPPFALPGPRVYLPPPPGGFIPQPGPLYNPFVYPRYTMQNPVYQQPLGFPPRPINPPLGVLSHQRQPLCIPPRPINPPLGVLSHQRQPLGFPPRPINPPIAVLPHQRPAVIAPTYRLVTLPRPLITPVAPAVEPDFKVYVGRIAPSVDSDFVLSLLKVCGVVKSWRLVINPIDRTRTSFGFCDFETAEGSFRAMRLLNKLSIDGQELVVTVNEATRAYLQKFGENTTEENAKEATTEENAKEAETGTRDGIVSLADNGNDSSIGIPDLRKRGAVVVGQMSSQGKTKRCRYSTEECSDSNEDAMQKIPIMIEDRMKRKFPCLPTPPAQPSASIKRCRYSTKECSDSDEDAMQKIPIMIEDRMKSKFPCLPTPPAQPSASIIDEKGDNDMSSSALEDRKIRRQCEEEEHLWETSSVGSQDREDGEVSPAEKSSLQIDAVSSMHASMECESTVEHERKHQHREREFPMDSDEEKGIVCLPGLVSDKHNSSARGERGDLESPATSKSGNEETLDANHLLAAVPKTKEELFAYDVDWAIYDKHGLHEKMRPWISEKTIEIFGEEIPEFVEYVVAATKAHIEAPRMLEALESLMDHKAEKFALSVWTKLIFEIKKAETGKD